MRVFVHVDDVVHVGPAADRYHPRGPPLVLRHVRRINRRGYAFRGGLRSGPRESKVAGIRRERRVRRRWPWQHQARERSDGRALRRRGTGRTVVGRPRAHAPAARGVGPPAPGRWPPERGLRPVLCQRDPKGVRLQDGVLLEDSPHDAAHASGRGRDAGRRRGPRPGSAAEGAGAAWWRGQGAPARRQFRPPVHGDAGQRELPRAGRARG
mmetsp:Transcript_18554/g.55427  ORF Transcript_18554/g.55427 Transcript_18554/m.55427 type:complete len:210 (-) Transcript_18554:1093-1722(-)